VSQPATPTPTSALTDPVAAPRSMAKWCLLIFTIALLLRAVWGTFALIRADDPLALEFPDEQQYWRMAVSLRSGEGLTDEFGFRATRMPLYPGALSLVASLKHGIIVAKAIQWGIGAAVAALTAAAGASLFGRRVGVLAGLFVASDPFLVFFSSLLLTETLHLAALVGLWWIAWPILSSASQGGSLRRWIAVGCAAALCVYVRESSAGLVAILCGYVVICRRFDRRSLLGAVLAALVVAAALTPWLVRNHRVTGAWCWLTHRGGISLYDGVGPLADGSSDLADLQQMPAVKGLDEVEWNRYFLRESIDAIRKDPARIIRLAVVKWVRTWNPFPNVETYQSKLVRSISAAWTFPVFALAALGVILLLKEEGKAGVRDAMFLLLPALYLSALHSLFVGSVRYRLSAMPMLEVLAAVALFAIVDRVRGRPVGCRVVDE